MVSISIGKKKVVVSEDRERLYGVFGAKAPIVPHETMLEALDAAYRRLYKEEPTIDIKSLDTGAKVVMEVRLPLDRPLDVGNGDVSDLMLYAQNSYTPGAGLKIRTGVMRLICSNGAVAGRQIGFIGAREFMGALNANTLAARLNHLVDKSKALTDVWQRWMDVDVSRVVAGMVFERQLPRKFVEPLLANETYPMNKYNLYNLATRRATHDTLTDRARWTVDNIIAKLFYGDYFETAARDLERSPASIDDADIRDTVTETDDILH